VVGLCRTKKKTQSNAMQMRRRRRYVPLRPRSFDHKVHNSRPYQLQIRLQRFRQARGRKRRLPVFKPYRKQDGVATGLQIFLFAIGVRFVFLVISYLIMWYNAGYMPSLASLFYASQGWDNYAMIARLGYSYAENGRYVFLVFFPLYVYLIRFFAFVMDYVVAAYIIAFISYGLGVYYLHRLVRLEFSNSTAWWAVVLISIAPVGFFFGTPMTESLMLLTSAACLYYIRSHKWALAGLAGAFASFTRMVGVILILAAIVEFVTHYRFIEQIKKARWDYVWWLVSAKGVWIFLMLVGAFAYLLLNWVVAGSPFQFMYYQRTHWFNSTQYFGRTIMGQFRLISNDDANRWHVVGVFIPNIIAFTFSIAMLVYGCLKKHSLALIIYALGYVFMSFSAAWLLAGARYILVCIPLFIFLAEYVDKKPIRGVLVTVAFIVGLIPFLSMFLRGGVF